MAAHRIGREVQTHRRWDIGLEPVLHVQPGDVVTAETDDFAGGQITRSSTASELLALDLGAIYPLADPWRSRERGRRHDLDRDPRLRAAGLGWACIIPGLGLLPRGEFSEPSIRHFDLTGGVTAELCPGVQIPIEPFCGTMGVPGPGMRGVPIPVPHTGGGNIDNRHLTRGATLYLPSARPAASSRSGTRTLRRATARSPSPASSARWRRPTASAC